MAGSVTVAATLQLATGLLLTAVADRGAWFTPATGSRRPLRCDAAGAAIRIGTRP